ncbi:type VII toxin-antitoxin system HepT family RNase toxin [Halonatronum saccharophilum]|uniref:type VII toxin-antitoxin system HepT family RNase toxin n=1 Tax=Halonatronum saccharophilum TaxID=150060 RepID=UPI0004891560|nr:DUF86 domain-containing protein [Halonatronum saccharophilum]
MTNRVVDKIKLLEDNLSKLEVLKEISQEEFLNDFRNIEAAKHLLQTSVEIMIDIANNIIAAKRLGKPETSADGFRILAQNEIIDNQNKDKYILMTKFRNRVVHMYSKVDEKEIYSIIQNNLLDYKAFIQEICKFY